MKSAKSIAGYIAEQSDWIFSNLKLQKLVYLCQLFHMGYLKGEYLFQDDFEAWDYGPVVPGLYHELKMFGAKPVAHYSGLPIAEFSDTDTEAQKIVDDLIDVGRNSSPGQLVGYTHRTDGAWARNYTGVHGIIIPKAHILTEYETLYGKKRDSASTSN